MVTTNVLDNWRTIQKYKKKKDKMFVGDTHISTAWTGGSPTDFTTTYATSSSGTTTGTSSGMSVTSGTGTGGYATSVTTSGYVYTPVAYEDDLKEAEKRIEELEQQVGNLENLYGRMKKLIEELTQKVAENNAKLAAEVGIVKSDMEKEIKDLADKEYNDYMRNRAAINDLLGSENK